MNVSLTTTTGRPVILLPLTIVRPHEQHDPQHAAELSANMLATGCFTHPICLDRETMTLLDGHHRFEASRSLELCYVPGVLLDYGSDEVRVTAWRHEDTVTREDVITAAISGKLMAIKTSRHTFGTPVGECRVPLARLRTARFPFIPIVGG